MKNFKKQIQINKNKFKFYKINKDNQMNLNQIYTLIKAAKMIKSTTYLILNLNKKIQKIIMKLIMIII